MWVAAQENSRSRRLAQGLCGICFIKSDPLSRQPVQIGRMHIRITVTAQHIGALGIGHQE